MTATKICGLTNLADARWAWRCGADLLGFVLVPSSPRHVPLVALAEITAALRAEGCRTPLVGVFANAPLAAMRDAMRACKLDLVQLHGDEPPELASALERPTLIAGRVRERVPWEELAHYAAWAYVLDSWDAQRLGGTGRPWRWELLTQERPAGVRLILAGGLTPENVQAAISQARPWGVDVSSGVETSPGRKDWDKVERFVRNVRENGG